MTPSDQIQQDLRFVRDAVARRDRTYRIPPPIAILWAIYVLVGYALLDWDQRVGGMFLMIAGIAGGIASGFIGRAWSRRAGEMDAADAWRHMLHWGSIFLAVVAVIVLAAVTRIDGQVMGQFIALVIGVIYFLGGVHFDRNFIWLGLLLMAGSIGISFVPRYPWTALGVLVAMGLVVPLLFRRGSAANSMVA